ncbi:MAG TPA: hypothetical protein VJ201_05200 [Candidatus Babeliales bacterium]|nr:hypothetical protein [Candidatus Babeliales bacterium]
MESYKKWDPLQTMPGLAGKYRIDVIHDSSEYFSVSLLDIQNQDHKIKFIWKDSLSISRKVDFSQNSRYLNNLKRTVAPELIDNWSFFKVENSKFLAWLSIQSDNWSDYMSFEHYHILGPDSLLDIVANYEPIIELKDC